MTGPPVTVRSGPQEGAAESGGPPSLPEGSPTAPPTPDAATSAPKIKI